MSVPELLTSFRPMYEEERLIVYERTKAIVVGTEPKKEQFLERTNISKYPPIIQRIITTLCLLVLAAAFVPSSIRLFEIGRNSFLHSINDSASATLVGLATILLAETGQVVCTLALAVLNASRFSRNLLWASAAVFTSIALVGNIEVSKPFAVGGLFSLIESLAPSIMVLSMSYILKEQFLTTIGTRYHANAIYLEKLADYEALLTNPETSPSWSQTYAQQMRNGLRQLYNKLPATRELSRQLLDSDWIVLTAREIRASDWSADLDSAFKLLEQMNNPQPVPEQLPAVTTPITSVVTVPPTPKPISIGAEIQAALAAGQSVFKSKFTKKYITVCTNCEQVVGQDYDTRTVAVTARANHIQNCPGKSSNVLEPTAVTAE